MHIGVVLIRLIRRTIDRLPHLKRFVGPPREREERGERGITAGFQEPPEGPELVDKFMIIIDRLFYIKQSMPWEVKYGNKAYINTLETFYCRPRMRLVMRSVASVCLSCLCSNVWKRWHANFTYRPSPYIKVFGSRSRSQEQKGHTSVCWNIFAGGPPLIDK